MNFWTFVHTLSIGNRTIGVPFNSSTGQNYAGLNVFFSDEHMLPIYSTVTVNASTIAPSFF